MRVTPSASRRPCGRSNDRGAWSTIRRSSATEPALMSSRVEFVPQSTTATGVRARARRAYTSSRSWAATQRPTGSSKPARKRRVVRVEALHALARAADAPRRARALVTGGDAPRRAPRRTRRAQPRAPRGRRRALLPARHRPLRAGSPPLTRPCRRASSAWASACRRRAEGALRITTGRPSSSRATTSKAQRGALPSSSVTTATSFT